LKNPYFKKVEKWKSLTVGIEENDSFTHNDSKSSTMVADQWYVNTCDTYEV